jgi:crotonobetainyl-CoA:carnitine CoA-transferase CaiB-like acyl-CoA transferase
MSEPRKAGVLAGMTVLERADGVAAAYAGRLLASLGADVIMLEPPEGAALRRLPTFLDSEGRRSALFEYLAAGKRSVVYADPADLSGDRLRAWRERADIVLDDTPLNQRKARGFDEDRLRREHPGLVYVSVLPFGAVGPRSGWRAEEINILHAGGEGALLPNGLALELFPDRPPVKIYGHFGMYQGGTSAAIAAIAALLVRPSQGGQSVDISIQDTNLAVGAFAIQRLGEGVVENRRDRSFRYGGVVECRDGFVEVLTLESRQWDGLRKLMGDPAWAAAPELEDSLERGRRGGEINAQIRAWAKDRRVEDVVADGQRFGVPVARYNSPAQVLHDPHERARGVFQPVEIVGLGPTDLLIAPFKLSATPPEIACGAPAIGRSGETSSALAAKRMAMPRSPDWADLIGRRPLEGLRVADFTLHAAGPFCTHILSLLGAQCIKIESSLRPDIFRRPHPVYGRLKAATFDQVSSNKLSAAINLKEPRGIELAKRLVAISDVAAESFRPGVMERLGLGYDALRLTKPDLVMVSVSSSGQTGPDRFYAGYAPLFAAWGGLGFMTGYPDGPPVEVRHVMDHSVGLCAAFATVAAIFHERATGEGQHVDVAAREVAMAFVGDALLQAAAGLAPARTGNREIGAGPHGVYPCRDPDSWISIAVGTDAQWRALAEILCATGLGDDPHFAAASDRAAHAETLDEILAARTRAHAAGELAARLQQAGVAAIPAWSTADLAADPHLRARGALTTLHGAGGESRDVVGSPFHFSGCETVGVERWTPRLGEHNDFVFGELLGLSPSERASLIEEGVIA